MLAALPRLEAHFDRAGQAGSHSMQLSIGRGGLLLNRIESKGDHIRTGEVFHCITTVQYQRAVDCDH